jgi:hypothetical protein
MKPNHYFDIVIAGSTAKGDGAITALPIMTRLISILHGMMRTKGLCIALAFPKMREGELRHPGNVVRVFAQSRDDLDIVVGDLDANKRIVGHVHLGYPKSVAKDFDGEWCEFRRFRIPSEGHVKDEARERRLDTGESLPYFRLKSKDNGNVFSLHVQRLKVDKPKNYMESMHCLPDSYGLSVKDRSFALPVLR